MSPLHKSSVQCDCLSTLECLEPVVSRVPVSPNQMSNLLEMMENFKSNNYQRLLLKQNSKSTEIEFQTLFKDVLAMMESYLCQAMSPIVDAFRYTII